MLNRHQKKSSENFSTERPVFKPYGLNLGPNGGTEDFLGGISPKKWIYPREEKKRKMFVLIKNICYGFRLSHKYRY